MTSLPLLAETIKGCTACPLHRAYKGPVPPRWGPGVPRVMVVGEAPGELEDKQGAPFVGRSGIMLAEWLSAAGVEGAFITNVVKCRPPDNDDPKRPWLESCAHHLTAELIAVAPRLIVCVGRFAGNAVLVQKKAMGVQYIELHGLYGLPKPVRQWKGP